MTLLKRFYKLADLPNWVPKWVKDHPDIKKAPKVLNKQFPIDDFEIKIDYDNDIVIDVFVKNIKSTLDKMEEFYSLISEDNYKYNTFNYGPSSYYVYNTYKPLLDSFLKKYNLINNSNLEEAIKSRYIYTVSKNGKEIKIRVFKLIEELINNFHNDYFSIKNFINPTQRDFYHIKYSRIPKRMEDINGFGAFANLKYNQNLYLVLSKKPEDILRMSTGTDFSSCQNIYDGIAKECAVSTALYSNIAILYITDKSKTIFGDKILYRTILRVLKNENGDEGILISQIYPDYSDSRILDIFKDGLRSRYNGKIFLTVPNGWTFKHDYSDLIDYEYKSYEEPYVPKDKEFNIRNFNIYNEEAFESLENFKKFMNSSTIIKNLLFENISKLNLNIFKIKEIISSILLNNEGNANLDEILKLVNKFITDYKSYLHYNKYED